MDELYSFFINYRYHAHVGNDAGAGRGAKKKEVAGLQLGGLDGLAPIGLLIGGARNIDAGIGKRQLEQGRAVHSQAGSAPKQVGRALVRAGIFDNAGERTRSITHAHGPLRDRFNGYCAAPAAAGHGGFDFAFYHSRAATGTDGALVRDAFTPLEAHHVAGRVVAPVALVELAIAAGAEQQQQQAEQIKPGC